MVKKERGITLIALVITIIVLLILAGISISMLTGQNGILNRAQEAKEKTEDAVLEEKIKLLTAETLINEYTRQEEEKTAQELQNELNNQGENVLVIQWDKYIIFDLNKSKEYRVMNDGSIEYWGESTLGQTLLNAKTANSDQITQDSSTRNIIGIDNFGNTVNMLLWEYTLIDDSSFGKIGTYGLNDKNGLDGDGVLGRSAGYIGDYTDDGKIFGTVPAYISKDGGDTYISVTSMVHTFYDCSELVTAPEIPNTVTNMHVTFYKAVGLINPPNKIPNSVINMNYTFIECTKLENVPELGNNIKYMIATYSKTNIVEYHTEFPDSLETMKAIFQECKSLTAFNIKNIPQNVKDISWAFSKCSDLEIFNSILPKNLEDMSNSFRECTSLQEFDSLIPDGVKNLQETFINCNSLVKIPSFIPSSVENMFQTFAYSSNLEGSIQINANLSEKIVYNYQGTAYKDYDNCFKGSCNNSEGIIILNSSQCSKNILQKMIENNDKIKFEA